MKRTARILALCLALIVAMSAQAFALTTSDLLQKSYDKMSAAQSYSSSVVFKVKLSNPDGHESITLTTKSSETGFDKPLKLKTSVTTSVTLSDGKNNSTQSSDPSLVYMDPEYVYIQGEDGWGRIEIGYEGLEEQIVAQNAKNINCSYLKSIRNPKIAGSETVNGIACYKVKGILTGNDIQQASDDITSTLEGLGLDSESTENLGKELPSVSLTIWISKKTFLPVRFSTDMKKFFQTVVDAEDSGEINVDNCTSTVTFSSYNSAKDFKIPSAALKAEIIG